MHTTKLRKVGAKPRYTLAELLSASDYSSQAQSQEDRDWGNSAWFF
jgi:hypothetical protein